LGPGFRHAVCSTFMALPPLLPFFAPLKLAPRTPPTPLAHPFDDGTALVADRSVTQTASRLRGDANAYRRLIGPLAERMPELLAMVMGPPRPPGDPLLLLRFGLPGLLSALSLAGIFFQEREARALLAGAAALSLLALDEAGTGAMGMLMLASAHAGGWPVARGGSESVAAAMVHRLQELGGQVLAGQRVASMADLPEHRVALLDLVPKGVLELAHLDLTSRYR